MYQALQVEQIQNIVYFLLLNAFLPSFGSYSYFFMLDVVGVNKFQISMLSVLSFVMMFLGSVIYRKYLV